MATVQFGSTTPRQPVGGEMRRFVVKSRIDGRNGAGLAVADTNEAAQIKAGWFVNKCWAKLVAHGTHGDVFCWFTDSAGVGLLASGGSWSIGGSAGNSTTQGTAAISLTGPTAAIGSSASDVFTAAGGIYYGVADYVIMALGQTGATFDGVVDFFMDVTDLNAYENPAAFTD